MPSTFYGLNLALRALLSHQQAIQVTQHNVANANTPGYRRQQAVLVAGLPYSPPAMNMDINAGQTGGSVMVDRIQRFNLNFFDDRYRREVGDASRWSTESGVLQQLEATLAENSTDGLAPKLDAFFSGWQAVSADPTNTAVREDLRAKANDLTQAFNRRASALTALRTDQDLAIQQHVNDINTAATHIANLNVEIARVIGAGEQPNDLLDERDRAMDQLAQWSGAQANTQANGEMIVSINGHALVMGKTTFPLTTAPDPANANLAKITWADGQAFTAPRGELAGLLDARDRVIPAQQLGLDQLAQNLFQQVNTKHVAGLALDGATTNVPFFEPPDPLNPANPTPAGFNPVTAQSLRLSVQIQANVANIAAAATNNAPGDGDLARQIGDLQQQPLMNGNTATFTQAYIAQVGVLGLEGRNAAASASDRKLVADSLDQQRESVGGVSLDEEAANLMQSQRAYEAAARTMTAVDDMINRIINGMGRVGL